MTDEELEAIRERAKTADPLAGCCGFCPRCESIKAEQRRRIETAGGAIALLAEVSRMHAELGAAKGELHDRDYRINELEREIAAAQSERLELARIYDPNCDTYDYQTQSEKLNAMASLVDAVQDMSVAIGSDPEGCLYDVPDAVLGELASAKAKNDQLNTEGEVLRQILSHRWELLHDAAAHVPTSTELYRLISVELDSGEVRDMQEPKS